MNKKTKLLLVLLSSTALTAGAFGLAACSGEAHNEEYYAQYQQYVSATAEGEVLSYEDWLIGILEDAKGEKGDKGDTGEAGKAGTQWTVGEGDPAATSGADGDFYLNKTTFDVYNKANGTWTKIGSIKGADGAAGATGNGIDTIVYKGGALEVSLTSGDKITVALPDEITHVHTYGENAEVITIMDSSYDHQGVGYIQCNQDGCEHKELVVIPIRTYRVAVEYKGTPLANVSVSISGEGVDESGTVTAKTDENGEVLLDVDALGEYTVSVEGYTVLGSSTTSSTKTDMEIEVAKSMIAEVNGWGETTYSVEESGTYAVTVKSSSEEDWWGEIQNIITCQAFDIVAGEENAKVKVSLNSTEGIITDAYGNANDDVDQDGSYTTIIRAGETDSIGCSINSTYFETGKYTYGDTIIYSINVEYLEAPADGTVEDLSIDAIALTEEEGITMTAEPDQWIYYTWTNPDTGYNKLNVTLGEGTTLEFTTQSSNGATPVTLTESGTLQFTNSELTRKFSFKVKSSTGNISISADLYAAVGDKYSPAELTLDTATAGTISSSPKYYHKWTATEAGNYTLIVDGSSTAEVYSDAACEDLLLNIQSDLAVFNAEAGATYYIAASTKNVYDVKDYSITLRKTVADDAGYSAAYPIELTSESVLQFNDFDGTRYYSFTNSGADPVTFKLVTEGNEDTYISLTYYSDNTYSSSIGYGDTAITVEAGQTIYIKFDVYESPSTLTGTTTVEVGVPEPPVEPDIPDGVDPTEVQIPSGGNAISGAGYWKISVTAEHLWTDYYEVTLYFIGDAGTYNITCQEGATLTDRFGDPLTQIVSTGTGSQVRFYLDADKIGEYIITITAVTEEA